MAGDPSNNPTPGGKVVGVDAPPIPTSIPVNEPSAEDLDHAGLLGAEEPVQQDELGPEEPVAPAQQEQYPAGDLELPTDDESATRRMAAFRAAHNDLSPEQAAEAMRYAATVGVDPQVFAGQDISHLKFSVDTEQLDRALMGRPKLAKLLNDTARAPLAKDDVGPLGWLEDAARWAVGTVGAVDGKLDVTTAESAPAQAFRDAMRDQRLVILEAKQYAGLTSQQEDRELARVRSAPAVEQDYGAQSWLSQAIVGGAKFLPMVGGQLAASALGTAGGLLVGQPAAGAIGGNAAFNFIENVGPVYEQLRAAKKEDGTPLLTDAQARVYAGVGSAAFVALTEGLGGKLSGYLLEKVPGAKAGLARLLSSEFAKRLAERFDSGVAGALAKSLPGGEALLNRVLPETARAVLPPAETYATVAARFAARTSAGAAAGALFVAHQQGTNAATQYVASKLNDPSSHADIHDVVDAWGGGFAQGLEQMWAIGALEPGRAFLEDLGRAHQFQAEARKLEVQTSAVEASKLAERSPELAEQHLAGLSDEPRIKYISPAAADRYFSGKKIDPEKAISELTDDAGAYSQAKQVGGKIPIPEEKLFARLKGTEHLRGIQDDLSEAPDSPSTNEALEQITEKARQVAEGARAENDGADVVREDFQRKALAAGERPQIAGAVAELVSHAYRKLGSYFGWTADEAYRKVGEHELVGAFGERVPQGVAPGGIEPGVRAAMRARFLELKPEQRVERFYRDQNTGLYNRRGDEQRPADAARPFRARFELGGQKYLNDTHGHDVPDGAFRAMAQVLRDSGINDGAKLGDVEADVATPEAAQELAKKMAEASGMPVRALTREKSLAGKALDDFFDADKKTKEAEIAAGTFPERKSIPKQFLEGAPEGADQAEFAKAKSQATAEKLKAAKAPEGAAITPELREAFDRHIEEKDPFDTIHFTPEGLLTAEGWHLAREVAPKKYVVSADLRGIREMNGAFGKEATDRILSQVSAWFAKRNGADFDVAHPHGDEFFAQGDDEELLGKVFKEIDAELQKIAFIGVESKPAEGAEPRLVLQKGVRLAHGIGQRFEDADGPALQAAKQRQDAEGKLPVPEHVSVAGDTAERLRSVDELERRLRETEGYDLVRVGQESGSEAGRDGRPAQAGEEQQAGARAEGEGAAGTEGPVRLKLNKDGRGYFEFIPGDQKRGTANKYRIRLLPDADQSTLAHEFSHAFGRALADMAARKDAPEPLRTDYAALTKWMGYESPEARLAELRERSELSKKKDRDAAENNRMKAIEAKEERLSHAFESYLGDGRPPNEALARTFQRFRNWMLKAYRVVNGPAAQYRQDYDQRLNLPDNVRAVFDRWFASDAAVREASVPAEPFQELLSKLAPEERAKLEEASGKAHDAAVAEMVRRVASAQHDEVNGFIKEQRDQLRGEVEQEIDAQPVYRALKFLQTGELPDPNDPAAEMLVGEGGAPMKLDRSELVEKYGADFVRSLPKGIFAEKGDDAHAMSADGLASALKFQGNGEDLVKALQGAMPRMQALEAEVQRRLTKLVGPELLQDPQRLALLAEQAVHNEEGLHRTYLAIEALRRKMGAKGAPLLTPERAAALALRFVDARTVGELTRGEQGLAGVYLRQEREAAKRAAAAFRAGNDAKGEGELSTVLLNQAMYRRATQLREQLESGREKLQQSTGKSWQQALGLADPAFQEAHNAILQAIGLSQPNPNLPKPSIEGLVQLAGDNLQGVFAFDETTIRNLIDKQTPWKKLSVPEARAVLDAVTNLRQVATDTNRLDLLDKQMSQQEFLEQVEREAQQLGRKPVAAEDYNEHAPTGRGEQAVKKLKGLKADLTEMDNIVAKLGPRDGALARLLIDARRAARDREVELKKQVLSVIGEKFEKLPKTLKEHGDDEVKLELQIPPDPDHPMGFTPTRKWLWALFLNWGTESSRQRLRDGNGWSDGQVQKALNLLTPEESEFLQSILDATNGLFPELAKVHQKRTGLPLEKQPPSKITVNGREFAGGYSPLKYDVRFGVLGERQLASQIDEFLPNNFRSPVSTGSYTKSRAAEVKGEPVRISWDTLPAHLAQVTHDIAYGDWVRQVAALFNDKQGRFKRILNTYAGRELAGQFRPWLADVARDQADSLSGATAGFWEGLSGQMRKMVAMGSTMFNVQSYGRHLLDPLAAAVKDVGVPLGELQRAYRHAAADSSAEWLKKQPDDVRAGIYASSQVLRYREASHVDGIRKVFADAGVKQGLGAKAIAADATIRGHIGTVVDRTIFLAAYRQALKEGLRPDEAVRTADDAVTKTTPSFDVAERPALLRSKRSIAGAVMLMGYRSKMFQLHERAWSEYGWRGAATTAQLMLIGAAGSYLVHLGKKDDESWAGWLGDQALQETFGLVPVFGDAAIALLRGEKADPAKVPEARYAAEVGNALERLLTKWGDGETGSEKAYELLQVLLAGAGGPVVAVGNVHRAVAGPPPKARRQ